MIDPSIWQDEEFGSLSPNAKILFIGLFSNADDEGRIRANEAYLKSTIFMYDDKINVDDVRELRREVYSRMKAVQLYIVDGKYYIQLMNWDEYQKQHKDRIQASTLPGYEKGLSDGSESNDIDLSDNVGQMTDNDGVSKDKLSQVSLGKDKTSKDNTGDARPGKEMDDALDIVVDAFDKRPEGSGPLANDLRERYSFKPEQKAKGITTPHQDEAFRFAKELGIELKGKDTGRWIKIFKEADSTGKRGNLNKAYTYCKDHPNWFDMDNEARMNMVFFIYANGLKKK